MGRVISELEDAIYSTEGLIKMTEALKAIQQGVTRPTLISWCRKYGIGKKLGGHWWVDPHKLAMLLKQGTYDNA